MNFAYVCDANGNLHIFSGKDSLQVMDFDDFLKVEGATRYQSPQQDAVSFASGVATFKKWSYFVATTGVAD